MLTTLRTFMVDRLARSIQKAVAFNENLYSSLISPEVIFRHSRMSHFDQPTVASRFTMSESRMGFFRTKIPIHFYLLRGYNPAYDTRRSRTAWLSMVLECL